MKPCSIANDAPPMTKDKNGDGTVSSTELKEVLLHVNPKFTEEVGEVRERGKCEEKWMKQRKHRCNDDTIK